MSTVQLTRNQTATACKFCSIALLLPLRAVCWQSPTLQSLCKSLQASVACIYWKEWKQKTQDVSRMDFFFFVKIQYLWLFFFPNINTILYSKKLECYHAFFFWTNQRKESPACSSCCTTLAFLSSIAFPPHENSSLPRQLNWTEVIYVVCAKRKGFVRFQGRHGNTGGEKQLGWDMGITILSLNLHAYDQTWPHFAFAAWLPSLWSCCLETKSSKSNQWAAFKGGWRSLWCRVLLWLIVWMWQTPKPGPAHFCLHVEVQI